MNNNKKLLTVLGIVIVGALIYTQYQIFALKKQIVTEIQKNNFTASTTASTTEAVQTLYAVLGTIIENEEKKNLAIQQQLGVVSNTVTSLDKLSKSDAQLLKKYSKVYFLNEHYSPVQVIDIPSIYGFNKSTTYQIHSQVSPFLGQLLAAAKSDGKDLLVGSAYRSFATQASLKTVNATKFGTTKANTFSADQGYSEHQLGTTVDFSTSNTGITAAFGNTPEYIWLNENAHKYGFILSYPKGNTYYVYEPWHWRFVGIDLATRLRNEGKYFYDMDQKIIDGYLVDMFEKR